MKYDYSHLRGAIVKEFGTRSRFAKALGLSEHSLSLKMNSKVDWKQTEIIKACRLLNIPSGDVWQYFFSLKVQR